MNVVVRKKKVLLYSIEFFEEKRYEITGKLDL